MNSLEYLKILGEIKNKNYKTAFEQLFQKDEKFINDTMKIVFAKFNYDIKRLKDQKKNDRSKRKNQFNY